MTQYIPDIYFEYLLNEIAKSDELALCSVQPLVYFQAIWPALRINSTSYLVGNLMRPPTPNGFVYECVVEGVSGGIEPAYGVVQDAEFSDGSVTWKSHRNYSIANAVIGVDEMVITDETYGKKLTTPQKGSVTHIEGEATHTALICNSDRTLKLVTTCVTDQQDNLLLSGRTIVFRSFSFNRYNL